MNQNNSIISFRKMLINQDLKEINRWKSQTQIKKSLQLLRYDLEHFHAKKNYYYFFSLFTFLGKSLSLSLQEQKEIYAELQVIRMMILHRITNYKKDAHYKLLLKILGKIEILSLELSKEFDASYDKSKRELLYQIVFEIRNLSVAEDMLEKLPHQINLLEAHGFRFLMDLFQEYITILQNYVTKSEDFDDLIYYDRLISFFFQKNQKLISPPVARQIDQFLENALEFPVSSFLAKETYHYYIKKWQEPLISFLTKTTFSLKEITEQELMYQFHIAKDFSEGLLKEAKYLYTKYGEKKKTHDMRSIYTVDELHTLDKDDGFSCSRDGQNYRLGIHITNPMYYLNENNLLFEEGTRRTSSIYVKDAVLSSTFPSFLANDLFSLKENHVRFVFSSYYDIDLEKKTIWNTELVLEPVYVSLNDTYLHCNQVIQSGDKNIEYQTTLENICDLLPFLKTFFSIDDTYAQIHEDTHPKISNSAQDFIETLMIFQNHQIAKMAFELKIPLLYRNHEMSPLYKKNLMELKNIISKEKESQVYLHEIQVALGQYPKSFYDTVNKGHFGLNTNYYTHFTSPIRRIVDDYNLLMYQKFFFAEGNLKEKQFYLERLKKIATYLNERTYALRIFQKEYASLQKRKTIP